MFASALLFLLASVAPTPGDLAFVVAQEQFVIDATPAGDRLRGFDPMFGSEVANLIRMLGCEHYYCREVASKLIGAGGADYARPLAWACRSADPEIRRRAEWLLRRAVPPRPPCLYCGGSGWSEYGAWACGWCSGKGYGPVVR